MLPNNQCQPWYNNPKDNRYTRMAGHNKWSQIKHKKAITDSHKAREFTKISKLIKVAARSGTDPKINAELRLALEKAREVNMPKSNIDRILAKSESRDGQEIIYEGFGNDGIGILIKAYTDNVNRTVAEIRHTLSDHGGSLGTSGSVMWMFREVIPKQEYQVEIPTEVDDTARVKIEALLQALEDLDDVEKIWISLL